MLLFTTVAALVYLIVVSISAADASARCKAAGCVGVEVYYETLCGDSMRFINNQLVPSYYHLKDHLDIAFIPYGKAQHERDNATGKWTFTCQHGYYECRGNKAQACGLKAIQDEENSTETLQELSVKFVDCVMISSRPTSMIQKCADTAGLSEKAKNSISACESSQAGDDLLASHGEKTHGLKPNLSFVPTIVIDGMYSDVNQHEALVDFKGLICRQLSSAENNKPSICIP